MRKQGESELPPTRTRRWTFRRKAALLQALRSGTITFEQACDQYALSIEELRAWEAISSGTVFMAYEPLVCSFTGTNIRLSIQKPIAFATSQQGGCPSAVL